MLHGVMISRNELKHDEGREEQNYQGIEDRAILQHVIQMPQRQRKNWGGPQSTVFGTCVPIPGTGKVTIQTDMRISLPPISEFPGNQNQCSQ